MFVRRRLDRNNCAAAATVAAAAVPARFVFPCPVAAVPSRKVKVSSAAVASKAKAKPADRDAVRVRGAPANQEAGDEKEGEEEVPGRSALSVADAVVTEYEKLLAAIPTMARHMGKLQLDTEAMAEGEQAHVSLVQCSAFLFREVVVNSTRIPERTQSEHIDTATISELLGRKFVSVVQKR